MANQNVTDETKTSWNPGAGFFLKSCQLEQTNYKQRNITTTERQVNEMSVVIIGGNERMVCQYTDICKDYGCKAKVFPKEHGSVKKKIGNPDLMILFTNTVSHKMVITASQEAKKNNIPIARIHTSSATALRSVLDEHCAAAM